MNPEIVVMEGGQALTSLVLRARPLQVGRAPGNDLVLNENTISWHHATLWREMGEIKLRDLNSTNGTYVNGKRIEGAVALRDGDAVRFGLVRELNVRISLESTLVGQNLLVEDLDSGIHVSVSSDRFVIGSALDADLRVEGLPLRAATLLIHEDEELWLGLEEEERPLEHNQVFEVHGRRFRVTSGEAMRSPTVIPEEDRYPYRLAIQMQGSTGVEALLEHLHTQHRCAIRAENRAVLLYVMAQQLLEDRKGRLRPAQQGWCSDDQVALGIWGRAGAARNANTLHVLVHRLRKELESAGFDPWFIEKRRRSLRLRLKHVEITP